MPKHGEELEIKFSTSSGSVTTAITDVTLKQPIPICQALPTSGSRFANVPKEIYTWVNFGTHEGKIVLHTSKLSQGSYMYMLSCMYDGRNLEKKFEVHVQVIIA